MENLTLFQLNQLIRNTLDANLEPSYWVIAEIGEMRVAQKGHCYLELVEKEDDTVKAKVRANIWAYTYRNLSVWFEGMTGQRLAPGIKILCNATIQFHELYGLSLNIKDIDANFTLGERARKKQQVIDQLHEDGVFDLNREVPLPKVPQRIAVISSPTAAGFGDFMDQLDKNEFGYQFDVRLFKALMQGDEAANSIIEAMHHVHELTEHFDVLVIIRGGGSQIDLDCFDSYDLAAHVAQFPIPVITGIGHERDETVVDLVANTKMKTPTAVSEFLISGLRAFEEKLDLHFSTLYHYAQNKVHEENQHLSTMAFRLQSAAKTSLHRSELKIDGLKERIKSASKHFVQSQNERLASLEKSVQLLDPTNILKRGYTITKINDTILSKVKKVKPGDTFSSEGTDQIITGTVEKLNKK
ncbi:MAG: exodeoxyribonuclease VII large subunit [Bacteroidota bacterium]